MKSVFILSLALLLSFIPELFALIILCYILLIEQHYREYTLERETEEKSNIREIVLAH